MVTKSISLTKFLGNITTNKSAREYFYSSLENQLKLEEVIHSRRALTFTMGGGRGYEVLQLSVVRLDRRLC